MQLIERDKYLLVVLIHIGVKHPLIKYTIDQGFINNNLLSTRLSYLIWVNFEKWLYR